MRSALAKPGALMPFLWRRMGEEHISRASAALSFSSALAVVPALALVLATLAAFPTFSELRVGLQDAIVGNLVPDTGMKINDAVNQFVEQAGKLTAFGIIGLVGTAILLLLTIESALNDIFNVVRERPMRQRLLVFWAVMTVGPVLLGLGFSLFSYFSGVQWFTHTPAGTLVSLVLGNLLPTLLTWITIAFIYLIVPNRQTKLTDALIGAAVAALLLAALRYTFALYVIFMTSYQAIYGALAAVPVFLVWVYLVWLAVLIGGVVTAALPDWRYTRAGIGVGPAGALVLALEILALLASSRKEGQGRTAEGLAKSLAAPDTAIAPVLDQLRLGRFIVMADDGCWVLSRDLDRTPLTDLVHQFGFGLNLGWAVDQVPASDVGRRLSQHLRSAAESERTLLSVSLARVVAPPTDETQIAAS